MLFLYVVVLLILGSCTKNEVKLTFELPKETNTACRILYYASAKNVGLYRETVVEISAGSGEIVLPVGYPTIISLFSPSQKLPGALIYAERGNKFKISGQGTAIQEWEIQGNEVTDALTEWRIENKEAILSRDRKPEALNAKVEEYVKAHPDSRAAAIILYFYFSRRGNEKTFYKLQSSLDKKILEDEKFMTALSQSDLSTNLPDTPTIPDMIVLTGESGFADTVYLNKGNKTLLIFRTNSDADVNNDSVKSLIKRTATDSDGALKGKAVAELFIDTDSLNWRRHLRNDTINNLSRLWMPLGLADSISLDMGVRRTPYFIIIGPKGKELYRGDDWDKAIGKFESR